MYVCIYIYDFLLTKMYIIWRNVLISQLSQVICLELAILGYLVINNLARPRLWPGVSPILPSNLIEICRSERRLVRVSLMYATDFGWWHINGVHLLTQTYHPGRGCWQEAAVCGTWGWPGMNSLLHFAVNLTAFKMGVTERWDGGVGKWGKEAQEGRDYMYNYGWLTLLYRTHHPNTVKQLSPK